ncbi:hypothetical protein JZ751_010940 [Albula glossodonta]|uniref:Uncharacterized protein n=1 Tax=Albula glossodonta TaxID=121402 RepID=A0A8T2NYQ2_9TELE|nr:hypothetical protein JZ751_010940 [Albula glossodonta]
MPLPSQEYTAAPPIPPPPFLNSHPNLDCTRVERFETKPEEREGEKTPGNSPGMGFGEEQSLV